MNDPKKQEELQEILKQAFEENEGLHRALEVFEIGQEHYLKAIGATSSTLIFTDSTSNPIGEDNDIVD